MDNFERRLGTFLTLTIGGWAQMVPDVEYYGRRAREEREAILRTKNPQVREIHRQLAEAYELRVRGLSVEERRLSMHLVSAA